MKKTIILLFSCIAFLCSCDILDGLINKGDNNPSEDADKELVTYEFKSESDINDAIHLIYASMAAYIEKQASIEKTVLIDRDFQSVTETNTTIEKMWTTGFTTVDLANTCIRSLYAASAQFGHQVIDRYLGICFALKGFIYKNMFEHWGALPILDIDNTIDEKLFRTDDVIKYVRNTLEYAAEYIYQDNDYDADKISYQAVLLSLAEISSYYTPEEGMYYCKKLIDGFYGNKDIIFKVTGPETGKEIVIYTKGHGQQMMKEYGYIIGRFDIADNWSEITDSWTADRYGYWAFLRRNKIFAETVGCQEYRQLLPLPLSQLCYNELLYQNPGYESTTR